MVQMFNHKYSHTSRETGPWCERGHKCIKVNTESFKTRNTMRSHDLMEVQRSVRLGMEKLKPTWATWSGNLTHFHASFIKSHGPESIQRNYRIRARHTS
uniref:Ovule protein n=1 Tax=Panagrellus redivivus TaxID=6233 RepID=A0A7E4W042_PANRE